MRTTRRLMPPVGRPVHADALLVVLMADVAAKAASVLVTIANAIAARSAHNPAPPVAVPTRKRRPQLNKVPALSALPRHRLRDRKSSARQEGDRSSLDYNGLFTS